jgi:hypothetical protein
MAPIVVPRPAGCAEGAINRAIYTGWQATPLKWGFWRLGGSAGGVKAWASEAFSRRSAGAARGRRVADAGAS